MDHKLTVLVQVDLHAQYVHLVVTGCVTDANQHALYPVVARARTLIPPVTVTVDLTGATHLEAAAVKLLRAAINHDHPLSGAGPVEILVPAALTDHAPVPHHANTLTGGTRTRAASPVLRAA
ncbi:hypothetical protein [Kocuria sp. CPCC 205263]|uniref:hypothetical protein n=1 Tax=Kocuria sp. CPCC 205263 TaxID=3073555 RepID=UPI0034D68A1A